MVSPLVSALVVLDRRLALLSPGDAGTYPFVFQRASEPIGVITAITEQPVYLWDTTEQSPSSDVITDLPGGNEQVERAPLAIIDGMQLCIHATFGSTDQAVTPPFLAAILVAVRCAFI